MNPVSVLSAIMILGLVVGTLIFLFRDVLSKRFLYSQKIAESLPEGHHLQLVKNGYVLATMPDGGISVWHKQDMSLVAVRHFSENVIPFNAAGTYRGFIHLYAHRHRADGGIDLLLFKFRDIRDIIWVEPILLNNYVAP